MDRRVLWPRVLWPRVVGRCVLGAWVLAWVALASPAAAFCGFYVGGAEAQLANDATMVVLMREGTRTVMSMQNHYDGPPENFAMVVPVPVVLSEDDVRTLEPAIFDHVDQLASPRLVEYWEQDPCPDPSAGYGYEFDDAPATVSLDRAVEDEDDDEDRLVKVEAQFAVGEYDIVILSAEDSGALDRWLRKNDYRIPAGAAPLLEPYVQRGSKFFVAKVDVTRVHREQGRLMLSPLRFHYDTQNFTLPVRLGLINSQGTQDLVVHILARDQRYDVANYENVTIPTNLDVTDATREHFPAFYAALFDRVLDKMPGAVVTEYAWSSGSCDPCPTGTLTFEDLMTLGLDVMSDLDTDDDAIEESRMWDLQSDFVLTRLHARYGRDTLGQDLVFRRAEPITGGRETGRELSTGATPASQNNFQARYAIRHLWEGPIECEDPQRGRWGGPPPGHRGPSDLVMAEDVAFAPRGDVDLATFLTERVPELAVAVTPKHEGTSTVPIPAKSGACGACHVGAGDGRWKGLGLGVLGLVALAMRRRRRP